MNDIDKVPTIGISYNVELPGKKALVLQSFVERDCDQKDLDGTLDKLRKAADRQYAVGMIEVAKKQLEVEEKVARDHTNRIAVVEENHNRNWLASNRKGPMRLSEMQEKERFQAHANVEESKRRIDMVKKDLAEFQAMVGA